MLTLGFKAPLYRKISWIMGLPNSEDKTAQRNKAYSPNHWYNDSTVCTWEIFQLSFLALTPVRILHLTWRLLTALTGQPPLVVVRNGCLDSDSAIALALEPFQWSGGLS